MTLSRSSSPEVVVAPTYNHSGLCGAAVRKSGMDPPPHSLPVVNQFFLSTPADCTPGCRQCLSSQPHGRATCYKCFHLTLHSANNEATHELQQHYYVSSLTHGALCASLWSEGGNCSVGVETTTTAVFVVQNCYTNGKKIIQ